VVTVGEGHHFSNDYARLADAILKSPNGYNQP
jgi:type IV secretory pathway VirJ component